MYLVYNKRVIHPSAFETFFILISGENTGREHVYIQGSETSFRENVWGSKRYILWTCKSRNLR